MNRQTRRREARKKQAAGQSEPKGVDRGARPWYYRHGYHISVWSAAALAVVLFWYAESLLAAIVVLVLGQVAGIVLSRMGRV